MDIALPPELERFISEKVSAGRYPDANAVVAGALEALIAQDAAEDIERLRDQIDNGIRQLDAGEGEPWDAKEIKAEGRRAYSANRKKPG